VCVENRCSLGGSQAAELARSLELALDARRKQQLKLLVSMVRTPGGGLPAAMAVWRGALAIAKAAEAEARAAQVSRRERER